MWLLHWQLCTNVDGTDTYYKDLHCWQVELQSVSNVEDIKLYDHFLEKE